MEGIPYRDVISTGIPQGKSRYGLETEVSLHDVNATRRITEGISDIHISKTKDQIPMDRRGKAWRFGVTSLPLRFDDLLLIASSPPPCSSESQMIRVQAIERYEERIKP